MTNTAFASRESVSLANPALTKLNARAMVDAVKIRLIRISFEMTRYDARRPFAPFKVNFGWIWKIVMFLFKKIEVTAVTKRSKHVSTRRAVLVVPAIRHSWSKQ
jgi:hypothetical protein